MRVASIDIGTNTVLMLIADVDAGGAVHPLDDRQSIVRLGRGVDGSRLIRPDAFERCVLALEDYLGTIRLHAVERTVVTGTSAVRDAANREELIAYVEERTGLRIEVLSGDDEARWTYAGAVSGSSDRKTRFAVIDIGGGSTEITFGRGIDILAHRSIDVGAVRMTEQFLHHVPPLEDEAARMFEAIRSLVAGFPDAPSSDIIPVAVAGTATTLAAVELGLRVYDRALIAGHRLSLETVRARCEQFRRMTNEQLTQELAVDPGRADIIFAGAAILRCVMERYGWAEVDVSDRGLRYGVAMRASGASAWR
jgi:exopolyphosphatase / guanosine-5'-triphosphate,3'-diphosphate pyrophosphatase